MTGFAPPADDAGIRAAPKERDRARIEYVPASALGDGEAIDWIWYGWVARGFITLLVGLWKAGKSTLLAHLLHGTSEGGNVAGEVLPCKVLVIAEEGAGLWARRRDEIGIDDNVSFVIRPFKGRPSRPEWETAVRELADEVRAGHFDSVVVDTWQSVNPCHDENDAAGTMAALSPLHHITEAGGAVVLIHHPRKGDATEGQASRGSGALPGFADIIVELRRYDAQESSDRRRTLKGLSRFDETPPEIVIELTDDGYRAVGTKAEATREDRIAVIEDLLTDEPMSVADVRDAWPDDGPAKPGKRTVETDLARGYTDKRWDRIGAGRRGDPYRYLRLSDSFRARPDSYRRETKLEPPDAASSDAEAPAATYTPEDRRLLDDCSVDTLSAVDAAKRAFGLLGGLTVEAVIPC